MRKHYALLLGLAFSIMGISNSTAQNVGKLPELSTQQLSEIKEIETGQLVHFLIQASPDIYDEDATFVELVVEYYKALASGDFIKAQEIISIIYTRYEDKVALISDYIQKVLPLYIYLMDGREIPEREDVRAFTVDTVWAAPVDEMYYGLGDERNIYKPYGFNEEEQIVLKQDGARVKHNQSYLWGMVTVGDKVLWCTNTNYLCVGGTSGLGTGSVPGEDVSKGYQNKCWVCEFESGIYGKTVHAQVDPKYAQYSDTRIPRIYSFDTNTGVVEDITPSGGEYDMMLQNCQGLRSAGAHNGVAFFGGPSLYGSSAGTTIGSSFFAYDTDACRFIGCNDMSKVLDGDGNENKITDIRRWMVYDDILYAGVRVTDARGVDRGAIIRWYGDKENPWQFKIVGWTNNEAAELCVYNGRIYVGGWNTTNFAQSTVAKGDIMPEGGLQPVGIDYPEYKMIWKYTDYDKNRLNISTTYTAGLQVWKGKLYWGMFAAAYTIPGLATRMGYTDFTTPEAMAFILGTLRQTSFWRVDDEDNIELLYGEEELPYWHKFDSFDQYGRPTGEDSWTMQETGWDPVFGRAGYGQLFTAYTWTMAEYHGDLYCGTMNMENLIGAVSDNGNQTAGYFYKALSTLCGIDPSNYGFELLRWQNPDEAPKYITTNGFGNGTAYGIRNFTLQGDDLYVGSASPLNLEQYGGCHLFRVNESQEVGIKDINNSKKSAGILVKRTATSITIATVGGEALNSVNIYDTTGRTLATAEPKGNVVTLPIPEGLVLINVTSNKGTWNTKIK